MDVVHGVAGFSIESPSIPPSGDAAVNKYLTRATVAALLFPLSRAGNYSHAMQGG